MQTTTTTITRSSWLSEGPRVVEQFRGSAHPKIPTTRPVGARQQAPAGRRP